MLNKNAIAYAATSFAATSMNSVFFFYYVKLFLVEYKVSQAWFQFAQVSYMIWNAVNDPLFGYFQDNSDWPVFRQRKMSIYYGAPIWALTFMLPWFKWANFSDSENSWIAGIQLVVCLCAYDTMLTFVLLAHCSVFTEISTDLEDRLQLTKYHQVASVLGSTSVFLSSIVSDNMKDLGKLQLYCLFIAVFSCLCMRYTGKNVKTKYESTNMSDKKLTTNDEAFGAQGAFKITKQILFNRNFFSFVVMNLLQVFHNTFCANFLIIFVDHLVPKQTLPKIAMSFLYGASYILPQCLILVGGKVISNLGAYKVVMTSFFVQTIASAFMYVHGRHDPTLLAAFFILDSTIPAATFSLFNILVSDIIDDDQRKYSRKQPQSSMVFGTNALFTKPGNSLAPMLVVAVLNSHGYETLKNTYDDGGEIKQPDVENLHDVMFTLLCSIPLILSVCQIFIWSFYKLRSNKSIIAKHVES